MADNYIMLNGKRIDLTDEQVEKIFPKNEEVEAAKKSPFERVKRGKEYFYINGLGEVSNSFDYDWDADKLTFKCANYCTDKAMMQQRALHETLNRLLWRYSEEHGGDSEWDDKNDHWSIVCSHVNIDPVFVNVTKENGTVYFKDKKIAQSAIEEIVKPFMAQHPDFVW